MRLLAPALVGCALLLGCVSQPPAPVPDPKRALDRFAEAIERDDPTAAYALLTRQQQARVGRARFDALWRDNREELLDVARSVRDTDPAARAHARIELTDGESVVMVREEGGWRLQGGVMDAQALDTPLDAVAELRRALQRRSLPALLRVLSLERRAAWMAAFEQSLEQTSDPLDLEVEVRGDEAVVKLTGGGQILLRREAGRWQVWDVR